MRDTGLDIQDDAGRLGELYEAKVKAKNTRKSEGNEVENIGPQKVMCIFCLFLDACFVCFVFMHFRSCFLLPLTAKILNMVQ